MKINAYSGSTVVPYIIQKDSVTALWREDCMQGKNVLHIRLSCGLMLKVAPNSERLIFNHLGGALI